MSEFTDKSKEILQNTTQRERYLKNSFKKIESQNEIECHPSNQCQGNEECERCKGRRNDWEFSKTDCIKQCARFCEPKSNK